MIAVLYLGIYLLLGYVISCWVFRTDRPLVRLWFGGVFALAMLLWFPALISFLSGQFSPASQWLALALSIGFAFWVYFQKRPSLKLSSHGKECPWTAAAVLPLWLISLYLLSTHTIWQDAAGALHVGQSTYGDLAMHLGFITSIAEQRTFPPMYSLCPDTPVGYPFLSDSISSTFYQLGASLRFSTMLPAALALLLVFSGVYGLSQRWLKDRKTALFASYLFSLGGGFGFAYFFDLSKAEPGKLQNLFTAFYETPTNFVQNGLRWVNPIADMLIPQRATLFGWALLFACLYLLYRAVFEKETRFFYPLGVLAGALPLVHTHSFLALGIISAVYLLLSVFQMESWSRIREFLLYGLIAILLAAPQLFGFTFKQSESFLTLHFNWANVSDAYFWFYIKNWGWVFLLLLPALFSLDRQDCEIFAGPALIWFFVELIQFQPNTYDNNKLLFVTFFFACGLTAKYLIQLYRKLTEDVSALNRIGTCILAAVMTVSLFLSGVLTLGREAVSDYELISSVETKAAAFIRENTEPDGTFLTYNNHNNAVASLTGRNIVCGSGTFLFFHGINYSEREAALPLIFEQPSRYFDAMQKRYGIDYVYIGPYEKHNYAIDYAYFADNLELIYDQNGILIYNIGKS